MREIIESTRLDHIGIRVSSEEVALPFYEALGFEVDRRVLYVTVLRHRTHGLELNLVCNANHANDGDNILQDMPDKYPGVTHFALSVPSVDAIVPALKAAGIPISEGPVDLEPASIREVFVRDPDGNTIEFTERVGDNPPPRSPDAARIAELEAQVAHWRQRAEASAPSPMQAMFDKILGKWTSMHLSAAAELGLADVIGDGTATAAQIAEQLGCHEESTYRLLRGLASVGVFTEHPDGRFENNASSTLLREDTPGSVKRLARFVGDAPLWNAYSSLAESVRTGTPAFELQHGCSIFEYLAREGNEHHASLFHQSMAASSQRAGRAAVAAYDFSGHGRIVDIGGGIGQLLVEILDQTDDPELSCVLFDLPEVVANAPAVLEAAGYSERVEVIGGSFFDGVPPGDTLILKQILHDWSDEACTHILQHAAAQLADDGRLLIIEHVLSEDPAQPAGKLLDLEMLIMTQGGKERTERQWRALLEGAGFELQRIVETGGSNKVLVALPTPQAG
jgi:catechol 2,3-dioxygenase-like lactoylglutathione lyase family enzyme/predicted O-methyltransferase YrrM